MVVTGPWGHHVGYSRDVEQVSAVNHACLTFFEFGVAHTAEARKNQCQVAFPLERLIVLSCQLLVANQWWWGIFVVAKPCDPDAF